MLRRNPHFRADIDKINISMLTKPKSMAAPSAQAATGSGSNAHSHLHPHFNFNTNIITNQIHNPNSNTITNPTPVALATPVANGNAHGVFYPNTNSTNASGYSSIAVFGYSVSVAGYPIDLGHQDNNSGPMPLAQKVERCFVPRSRITEYLKLVVDLSFREIVIAPNVREVRNMQTVANIMTQSFYDGRLAPLEQSFPQSWMVARNRYAAYVKVRIINSTLSKEALVRRADLVQQVSTLLSSSDEQTVVKINTNFDMEY